LENDKDAGQSEMHRKTSMKENRTPMKFMKKRSANQKTRRFKEDLHHFAALAGQTYGLLAAIPVLQQGTNGAKVMSAIDANSEAILTQSLFTETALVWWI